MNAAKRRRDISIAATPIVNQNNDSRASSVLQSSPLRHLQRTKHLQQRVTKRVSLDLSKARPGSSNSPSHIRSAHHHSLSSVATSGVYIEEDSNPDEVIMCVDMRERGTVGCCYFESSTGSLHLVEDIQCGGLDVIDTCEYTIADRLCTD